MDITLEENAVLNEAARLILAEMKANPEAELPILVQALIGCGTAAAEQGLAAVLAEREACLADIAAERVSCLHRGHDPYHLDKARKRVGERAARK